MGKDRGECPADCIVKQSVSPPSPSPPTQPPFNGGQIVHIHMNQFVWLCQIGKDQGEGGRGVGRKEKNSPRPTPCLLFYLYFNKE